MPITTSEKFGVNGVRGVMTSLGALSGEAFSVITRGASYAYTACKTHLWCNQALHMTPTLLLPGGPASSADLQRSRVTRSALAGVVIGAGGVA